MNLYSVLGDARLAVRSWRKSPLAFLAVVLCLALGLGANMAVFSWANGFVLRPIAGASNSKELVVVDGTGRSGADQRLSYPDYRDLRERATVFSQVMVQTWLPMTLSADEGEGHAERISGEIVSANFFDALGVGLALGRGFQPEEDRGPGAHPVAVISHAFWQRRYRGAADVLGRLVRLNGHRFTIIGVAAEGFRGGITSLAFDVFVPITMQQQLMGGEGRLELRDLHWLGCWARLGEGRSLQRARVEVAAIAAALEREYPETNGGEKLLVFSLSEAPWGATNVMRPLLGILSAVTGIVLLVACANVAQLLLARGIERRGELAIRLSLGATRRRLVQQLLVEAALPSLAATAVGILVGTSSARLLQALVPPTRFPVRFEFELDAMAVAYGVFLALVTTLAFGLLPALGTSRGAAEESRSGALGARRSRKRTVLVVGQVALSMILLTTSGMFLQGLQKARSREPGFDPENLLLASVDLGSAGYDPARGNDFYRRLLEETRNHPAVAEASYAQRLPLDFGGFPTIKAEVEGYEPRKDEEVSFGYNNVGPRYLTTMRIPLVRGRDFEERDRVDGAPSVIVNETAAERYWSGLDPIGRSIRLEGRRFSVVGVARDGKYRDLYEAPTPYLYFAAWQEYQPNLVLHVRGRGGLSELSSGLRDIAKGLDRTVALYDLRPMSDHLGIAVFQYRIASTLLLVFGSLSLALSSIGLYGVISLGVSARSQEWGVRAAMGARRRDILARVVGEGMKLTTFGVLLGLLGAVAVARMLVQWAPIALSPEPVSFAAAATVLLGVAVVASAVPARRASRVDPVLAMRVL